MHAHALLLVQGHNQAPAPRGWRWSPRMALTIVAPTRICVEISVLGAGGEADRVCAWLCSGLCHGRPGSPMPEVSGRARKTMLGHCFVICRGVFQFASVQRMCVLVRRDWKFTGLATGGVDCLLGSSGARVLHTSGRNHAPEGGWSGWQRWRSRRQRLRGWSGQMGVGFEMVSGAARVWAGGSSNPICLPMTWAPE